MPTLNLPMLDDAINWRTLEAYLSIIAVVPDIDDASRIMDLLTDPDEVLDVWNDLQTVVDEDEFVALAAKITRLKVIYCNDCEEMGLRRNMTDVGNYVCESCRDNNYSCCERCDSWMYDDDANNIDGDTICESCRDRYASWCDECDEYYLDRNADDHNHTGCECDAPRLRFRFPANGHGTVANDERLEVELPSGVVSQEGVWEIYYALEAANLTGERFALRQLVDSMEPTWQKKDGNFTKRLTRMLYKEMGVKVPAALVSEIGNIARRHTSTVKDFWVEFTRSLNGAADEFWHDDSCWWGGHSESRCALKQWGGLAIRSYESERDDSYCPAGRAWIQPLNANLEPTHDTINAHAYVVYNGYGNLEGYAPVRIVAHLTGKTYKKIRLGFSPQYVNNSSGYLIADEATCADTEQIIYNHDPHYTHDHAHLEVAS